MINKITEILKRSDSSATNINPTILYNEGWMTRLLVEVSLQQRIQINNIDFGQINHWCSEGLLSSPFLARKRADNLAEGYTHADIVLGDFSVDFAKRGDITPRGLDGVFGVIEAKMGSRLSSGTKNAPNYNQASRNVACIAFNTISTRHSIFFSVVAPERKIEDYGIRHIVNLQVMLDQISRRFDSYDRSSRIFALKENVLDRAKTCTCSVLSYESWLDALSGSNDYPALVEFKERCYKFNRIG